MSFYRVREPYETGAARAKLKGGKERSQCASCYRNCGRLIAGIQHRGYRVLDRKQRSNDDVGGSGTDRFSPEPDVLLVGIGWGQKTSFHLYPCCCAADWIEEA
mgnify:CR=1 FL=1